MKALAAKGKKYDVSDEKTPGLFIRVNPDATVKSFLFYYRAEGRLRCETLGRYGRITLSQARELVKIRGGEIAKGADPAKEKIARRKADNFAALAKRFLEEHGEAHLKPSTLTAYTSIVNRLLLPFFGTMKLDNIDAADVSRWHQAQRKTPRQANQGLAILSKMLNLAEAWGVRKPGQGNPCKHIKHFQEVRRDRALSLEEVATLLEAMDAMKAAWESKSAGTDTDIKTAPPGALDCIRLMLFTGTRRGEIVNLRWDEVDLEALPPVIRKKSAKEKRSGDERPKVVALSHEAVRIIEAQRESMHLSPYVFPGAVPGKPWQGLARIWERLLEVAQIDAARIHDLRHTFGTTAGALGLSGPQIQAALNHAHPSTTSRYVNLKDQAKAEVARQVSEALTEARKRRRG